MQPFLRVTGIAAQLPRADVDTDAILPSDFLRDPNQNLASGLFAGWRYDLSGNPDPGFFMNAPEYRSARILISGPNFGCGSSREAAVWALLAFGIRCVIAPSFADIFYDNACKNGLLPAIVSQTDWQSLTALASGSSLSLTVDLPKRRVETAAGLEMPLQISDQRQKALIAALDQIDLTLEMTKEIDRYQAEARLSQPWVHEIPGRGQLSTTPDRGDDKLMKSL